MADCLVLSAPREIALGVMAATLNDGLQLPWRKLSCRSTSQHTGDAPLPLTEGEMHALSPSRLNSSWLLRTALLVVPSMAIAHPQGHLQAGWWAGFAHPLTGIDHALAMIVVGLWAVDLGRTATRTLPVVFPIAMLIGAVLAHASVLLPAVEPMIALSVAVIGGALAFGRRLPLFASAPLVGLFAVFHGYQHFAEASAGTSIAGYVAGFLTATVCLHAVGLIIGLWIARDSRHAPAMRVGGTLIAAAGTALFLS